MPIRGIHVPPDQQQGDDVQNVEDNHDYPSSLLIESSVLSRVIIVPADRSLHSSHEEPRFLAGGIRVGTQASIIA